LWEYGRALMGRQATSGIKERKRVTIYITDRLVKAIDLTHIQTQQSLGHRIDRTLFIDALLQAGLNNPETIIKFLSSHNGERVELRH
jgi:hypothetical protein